MRYVDLAPVCLCSVLAVSVFVAPTGAAETLRGGNSRSERETPVTDAVVSTGPLAPQWLVGSFLEARFGHAVSTAGDVNGDGFADLIIGVRLYDSLRGRAQLHLGSATGFNETPDWVVDGLTVDDQYGYSVGTAGDVNGDGFDDFLVGAPFQASRGHAFLYLGSAGVPDTVPDWIAEGDSPLSFFGLSVGTAGDVNGDGFDDVIVGAPRSYRPDGIFGQAKVFLGNSSGLPEVAAWSRYGTQEHSDFGFSVGTAGDVNGDGLDDVIVGAPLYDGADLDSGRVEVYLGSLFGPQFTPSWWAEAPYRQRFGDTVGTAGDVNDDGYADVIAGANYYLPFVAVFHGSPSGPSWVADWTDYIELGSVGTAGDVNGDGYDDVIVGSPPHEDPADVRVGAAFVYLGASSGLEADPSVAMLGKPGSEFGHAVGSAGDVNADGLDDVVVGAAWYESAIGEVGAAYIRFGPLDCADVDEDSLCPPQDCDDTNPNCGEDCTDDDGDGHCAGIDCDEGNPNCTADCTDGDGDLYCLGVDCDDTVASCTADCSDNDGDGLRGCADDCDDTNPFCGLDCTDGDGDGYCIGQDCDDAIPTCTVDCTDSDGDGLCPPHDCDDSTADCTTDCGDNDLDFVRDCDVDCDDANPNCRFDCTDDDGDGYCADIDCNDQDPYCASRCDGPNTDGDSILDYCDNCVRVTNADQADGDQDGAGDVCDVCPEDPSYASLGLETLSIFDGTACAESLGAGPSGNVYFGCKYYFEAYTRDGLFLSRVNLVEHQQWGTTDTAVGPEEWVYLARDLMSPNASNAYDLAGNRRMELWEAKRIEVGNDGYIYRLYFLSLPDAESFWTLSKWHPDGRPHFSTAGSDTYALHDLSRDICVGDDGLSYLVVREEGFANPINPPRVDRFNPQLGRRGKIVLDWGDDPVACEVDSHGTLYVADRAQSRLRIYDRAGRHVTDVGAELPSAQIVDLAMGPDNRLYVLYDTAQVSILTAPVFDWDGDSVLYCDDNCPYASNGAQSDLDLDGEGDACDLDDGLIYLLFEPYWLMWQDEEGYDAWNRYRGDMVELKSDGDYTQAPGSNPLAKRDCGLPDTWLNDYFSFVPDRLAFYLVSGVSGGVEGDLGQNSSGQTRPNANPCP